MGGGQISKLSSSPSSSLKSRFHEECLFSVGSFSNLFYCYDFKTNEHVTIKKIHIKDYSYSKSLSRNTLDIAIDILNIWKKVSSSSSSFSSSSSSPDENENISNSSSNNNTGKYYIIPLLYAYCDKKYCYFIMPYMNGGNLSKLIGKTAQDLERGLYVLDGIGSALNYLHTRGIIHRDLTPSNIGFNIHGRVFLMNFHKAISFNNNIPITNKFDDISNNKSYLAPEVCTRLHHHSFQSDFWSLGVIFIEILTGKNPFPQGPPLVENSQQYFEGMWLHLYPQTLINMHAIDPFDHYFQNNQHARPPPIDTIRSFKGLSDVCLSLINRLLNYDIIQRYGNRQNFSEFQSFVQFLLHDYIYNVSPFENSTPLTGLHDPVSRYPPEPPIFQLTEEMEEKTEQFSFCYDNS